MLYLSIEGCPSFYNLRTAELESGEFTGISTDPGHYSTCGHHWSALASTDACHLGQIRAFHELIIGFAVRPIFVAWMCSRICVARKRSLVAEQDLAVSVEDSIISFYPVMAYTCCQNYHTYWSIEICNYVECFSNWKQRNILEFEIVHRIGINKFFNEGISGIALLCNGGNV